VARVSHAFATSACIAVHSTHIWLPTASHVLVTELGLLSKQEGQQAVHAGVREGHGGQVEAGAVDDNQVLVVLGHLVGLLATGLAPHTLRQQQTKHAIDHNTTAALLLAGVLREGTHTTVHAW